MAEVPAASLGAPPIHQNADDELEGLADARGDFDGPLVLPAEKPKVQPGALEVPIPNDPKEPHIFGIRHKGEPEGGYWPALVGGHLDVELYASDECQEPPETARTIDQRAAVRPKQLKETTGPGRGRPKRLRARYWRWLGKGYGQRKSYEDPRAARGRGKPVIEVVLWCPIRAKEPMLGTPADHGHYKGRLRQFQDVSVPSLRTAQDENGTALPAVRVQGACPRCVREAEEETRDMDHTDLFWDAYEQRLRQRAYMIRRLRRA